MDTIPATDLQTDAQVLGHGMEDQTTDRTGWREHRIMKSVYDNENDVFLSEALEAAMAQIYDARKTL